MKKAKLKYQDELEAEIRSNKSRVTKNGMDLADSLKEFSVRVYRYDFTVQTEELENKTRSSLAIFSSREACLWFYSW